MASEKDNSIGELNNLDSNLTRWKEQVTEQELISERYQWVKVLLTTSILAVILIFCLVIISTLKSNLDGAKIAEAAQAKTQLLMPAVSSEVSRLAKELVPHYKEALIKEAENLAPELTGTVMREMDALVNRLKNSIDNHFQNEIVQLMQRKEQELLEEFPVLRDPKQHNAFRVEFNERMGAELKDMANQTVEKFMEPVQNTLHLISLFPPANVKNQGDQRAVEKHFLKLWLELAALSFDESHVADAGQEQNQPI